MNNQDRDAKNSALLRASQMVGMGLSQLLVMSYQEIDMLEARIKELEAELKIHKNEKS